MMKPKPILEIRNISKKYPGVQALGDVSFLVNEGEVHGLVGANGAGKSTLNKIISGAIKPDSGELFLSGEQILPLTPRRSQEFGIQTIYQDLNLVPNMTVMENIFLGDEIKKNKIFIDKEKTRREVKQILSSLGVNLDPDEQIRNLTVSYQQMVAVAAALRRKAIFLILDETTAKLTEEETKHLFERVRILKEMGLGMLYVSHHLDEIFEICDRVSILKDGKYMGTFAVKDISKEEIISLMVGYKVTDQFPKRKTKFGEVALSVQSLSDPGKFEDIDFKVHEGEILGFFGLVGSGRTELFKSVFGAERFSEGKAQLYGKEVRFQKPVDAVRNGLGFLPENRKDEGILLSLSVLKNISLPSLKKISINGFIKKTQEKKIVNDQVNNLGIITPDNNRLVRLLSGGNQQKVVLAKWLVTNPSVLILDQPTRGIDVKAKAEIYRLINQLAEESNAIIYISDELPEILGMCDRIIVLHEGKISGVLNKEDASQEALLNLAYGNI